MSAASAPLLPQPPELKPLWDWGCQPRHGQLIMIAGRPASQKSGFALFWAAKMGLPTLYFSADMTAFEATSRLTSIYTGETSDEVEQGWFSGENAGEYLNALSGSRIDFSFGSPITWRGIELELDAYMELNNRYPEVIVIDNLMDIEGCESEYQAQQAAMQDLTALSRDLNATVVVIHHATDKSYEAQSDPYKPPARKEIKNGLAEKPQLSLTVALEPDWNEFRVAVVKQRSGKADAAANNIVRMQAYPDRTSFGPLARG